MALIITHWAFWVVLALYLFAFVGLRTLARLRWRPAFWLRMVLVFLTILVAFWPTTSLAGYTIPQREIALLDLSDTVDITQQERATVALRLWQDSASNRLVILFNAQDTSIPHPADWLTEPDFSSALTTASGLFRDKAGRLLIFTGGAFSTDASIESLLADLNAAGTSTSFIHFDVLAQSAAHVSVNLSTPSVLWAGVPTLVQATSLGGINSLNVLVNGRPVEKYNDGDLWLMPPQAAGITTVEIRGTDENTIYTGTRFSAIEVMLAPRVLIVSQSLEAASGLKNALNRQGLAVDIITPEEMPSALSPLMVYQTIFLQDVLANRLSLEQMNSIETFVSALGRGLVVLGGRNSYTLGGYAGTPLETLLPLSLQAPTRGAHAPITFVMVLDRSGSMHEGPDPADTPPIDLAREAAIRALEHLSPEDYLGVLTYSTRSNWDVEIRLLGAGLELREAQDAISEVFASGGTNMFDALQNALEGINENRETNTVHILLLSDGVSFDGRLDEFQALASAASRQGMTISTISLGLESDAETMAVIAVAGNGRFFEVVDADELPRIMVAESIAARSEHIQLGTTNLVPVRESLHPALFGVDLGALPNITGYLALAPKDDTGVEIILRSANLGDPVLAAWQVGLGRVLAWTTDVDGGWANDWDREGVFWAQVARYSIPNPALRPLQVDVETIDGVLGVSFSAQSYEGIPLNFTALPSFTYRDIDGELLTYALAQTAPGVYQLALPIPAVGAYRGVVTYAGDTGTGEIPAPFAVNDPLGAIPVDAATAERNLEKWQTLSDGILLDLENIFDPNEVEAEIGALDWRTVVVAMLLAYWVAEIATRRRWMPWYE